MIIMLSFNNLSLFIIYNAFISSTLLQDDLGKNENSR